MKPDLEVAVLTTSQAFAALKEEWKDLYEDSARSTPFQSWPWLYSWWEAFGEEGYELRLITVREGRLLVGLIPLMLEHWWGFRKLVFIGCCAQMDFLARKGWEGKVSEAGIRALRQMDSWHVMDLRDVNPAAASWNIVQRWDGPRTHQLTDCYLFIEVKPWDRLLTSLSTKHRNTVRRTLRRAKEDDVVCSMLAGPGEAEQAARRLVARHRELRQGRDITWTHTTPQFESFIVAAARRMANEGLGMMLECWHNGKVILSSFTLIGDKAMYAYLVGVSQEAVRRYQWSSLGIHYTLSIARDRHRAYVCLGQGGDSYKQKWPHEDVPYYQIIVGRGRILWRLYLAYLSLRAKGVSYVKADSTPKMITNAIKWLRRLTRKSLH